MPTTARALLLALSLTLASACGDDDDGTPADQIGVGAQCANDDQCKEGQTCLLQFKGGYCGLDNCTGDADCPAGSACVAHEGTNYCFRICVEKIECNRNRALENESNCSANITFVDGDQGRKACVPPSAG
jgi:hypothetical protein